MARRAPPEVKIDGNRWLTTYADLMNNLLVMFIMLYAISVIDLTKYESKYRTKKVKGEIVEEWYQVTLQKDFNIGE